MFAFDTHLRVAPGEVLYREIKWTAIDRAEFEIPLSRPDSDEKKEGVRETGKDILTHRGRNVEGVV